MFYDSFEYNFLECILLRLSFNSSLDVKKPKTCKAYWVGDKLVNPPEFTIYSVM